MKRENYIVVPELKPQLIGDKITERTITTELE